MARKLWEKNKKHKPCLALSMTLDFCAGAMWDSKKSKSIQVFYILKKSLKIFVIGEAHLIIIPRPGILPLYLMLSELVPK